VIHNYGNSYEKWNIFVAWPHLWLKLGKVKPKIMLCETVLNLSTLRYHAIFGNVTSRHRARETMETPDFIPPTLWPQNSLDLNPVNYKVWSVMQEKVYKKQIKDIDELRARILTAWDKIDQRVDKAVRQWHTSSCMH